MKKSVIFFALAALLVIGAVSAFGDDGVPGKSQNGDKHAVKSDGTLAPHSVGHVQLKNNIVDCQKLVRELQRRVCGPLARYASKGADGVNGVNGSNGAQGLDGAIGAAGTNGTNGVDGLPGVNGENGSNGADGQTGATGEQGPKGETGDTGATGATGAHGYKGEKGATGEAGPAGPQGEPGAPGTDGKDGKDGLGNGTLVICLDGKGGINQAPCNGNQTPVTVVIVKGDENNDQDD